ncbi:hypothetical protein KGY71_08015 [Candidatus Bipolaricaulota bacterium]|nr:hypothetical protein [Candidatus Bipolaricaulota bacterium]
MSRENLSPLISEINIERRNLSDLVNELETLSEKIEDEPTAAELRAAGSILHDFYTGLEKVFRLIAVEIDGNMPSGEDWHKRLLDRMAVEVEDLRPPVIDGSLKEKLSEYLRFRHLFRHIYGFELNWDRCRPLVRKLPEIHSDLSRSLDKFEDFLREINEA